MPSQKVLLRGMAEDYKGIASGAITPGMLVELTSTADTYQAHGTAGGTGLLLVARPQWENDGADIDDDIASGDTFSVYAPFPGALINFFTSATIAIGEEVESDGVGGVRVYTSGFRFGTAIAASDLSGTNGRVSVIVGYLGV